jgi:iron complex outermembrane receptor protein
LVYNFRSFKLLIFFSVGKNQVANDSRTTRFSSKLIRQSITTTAAFALFLGLAGPVTAQDQGGQEDERVLEEVTVTGTHRAGLLPTETLSPVDVFDGTAIEQQASFDFTDTLTKLTPSLNTQRFPIADGTAFVRPVTLRNLAPDQTLVLVNSVRRHRSALVNLQLAPLGTVNQGAQAVDFSAIPAAAIKRVEILRDGASALYGSDAIAGVINVILKDNSEGFVTNAQYGSYYEGDGDRLRVDANAGFMLGQNGFINLSLEYGSSDITSRGNPRPDAAEVASIVGADVTPYNGFGQRWGDPDVEVWKFFLNAGIDLSVNTELYGFASYMDNSTLSGFFYRGPVLPPEFEFTARTTLQIDNNGDFLPDPAPQSLIDNIIEMGLNPADYVTADPDSDSGWALLNPIYTDFPGGYSPLFGADIKDYSVVFGVRGDTDNNFSWDVFGRIAQNEVEYVLEQSINPSLGRLSPTTFNPGTLTQEESEVSANFVKTFDSNPLNLAFGVQWRNETYKIAEGDPGSTIVGPTFAQFGVGSDGFQGFFAATAGKFKADSYAAYVDLEGDLSEKFSGAVALRYENPEDFDSTLDYKISGRYDFTDSFAIRATYNTGFRVPTPGQLHTLNITTTADTSGNLIPNGTYPVDNPVALALGSVPLTTEESKNFTIGLVWEALDNTSITFDYYDISVEDRIGLLSKTIDQDAVDELNEMGYPNAELLLNSSASYFSNAFDSDITGFDFMITSNFEVGSGLLVVDFRHNHNKQEIKNVKADTINASRVYDLENQVPQDRSILTFNYGTDKWNGVFRLNRYGNWKTTAGLFSPGDASDAYKYGSEILIDVEARYRFTDIFSMAIGAENLFDAYPDQEQDPTLQFLGANYALTSPFGFNGGFWYVRVTAQF